MQDVSLVIAVIGLFVACIVLVIMVRIAGTSNRHFVNYGPSFPQSPLPGQARLGIEPLEQKVSGVKTNFKMNYKNPVRDAVLALVEDRALGRRELAELTGYKVKRIDNAVTRLVAWKKIFVVGYRKNPDGSPTPLYSTRFRHIGIHPLHEIMRGLVVL